MKKLTVLFLLSGFFALGNPLSSCSSGTDKTKTTNADSLRILMKATAGSKENAIHMPQSEVTNHIQFQGKTCEIQVSRIPDESLPIIQNEQGDKFIDNRITIRINSQGQPILNQSFTKANFSSILNGRFLKEAILEGIVYDTIDSDHILFAASVSYPESDLYVPIRLSVKSNGKISIEKNDLINE